MIVYTLSDLARIFTAGLIFGIIGTLMALCFIEDKK